MYNPSYKKYDPVHTSWGQRVSDKLFGTNYQGRANLENEQRALESQLNNNYEFQKAVNINKYSWNQQGMLQAGINPLMASGSLGSLSSGPSSGPASPMDQGGVGETTSSIIHGIKDLLHEISPAENIRSIKKLLS